MIPIHHITLVTTFFSFAVVTVSLLVNPSSISELEGDEEVHFFCVENNNDLATDIVWKDPWECLYIPGSPRMEDSRVSAEGSRLSIFDINRNDTGLYACLRSNNSAEFAAGRLVVNGMWSIIQTQYEIYIHKGEVV